MNEPGQIEWFESFGSKGDLVMHMPYLSVSGANYLSCFHNNQGLYYTTSQVMGFIGSETCYLINESYQVHWIEVFPNPVITDLYINFNETLNNFTVSIIDMNGKVLSTSGLLDNTLQVNHLLKGNYILRIEQGSNIYLSKFTKN